MKKTIVIFFIMDLLIINVSAKTTVNVHEYANGLIIAENNGYMLFTKDSSIMDKINTGNCDIKSYDIRLFLGYKSCRLLLFKYIPWFDLEEMSSCIAITGDSYEPPAITNVKKIETNSDDPLLLFVVNYYKELLDNCNDDDIDCDYFYDNMLPYIPRNDIRILRNCIFAYYGYQFKSLELKRLFTNFEWYEPTSFSNDEIINMMSSKHKAILDTIVRYEQRTNTIFTCLHKINPHNWPDNESVKIMDVGTIENYDIYLTDHIFEDKTCNEQLIIFEDKIYKGNYK